MNEIENKTIYQMMRERFEKLNSLANSEKTSFSISEKEALENAQELFERYLEAELIYQELLFYPMTGAPLENSKNYILKSLCENRTEKLNESITYHEYD